MEEEKNENTEENPVKEVAEEDFQEEVKEEPQPEEKETPKEKTEDSPEQYTEREKRYYARMKQAENIAKQAREETAKLKKSIPVSDIDVILEIQEATRGLSSSEIAELKMRANALGVPLTEARKDENFALWQKAYKEKVEKENAPLPSTNQGNAKKEKSLQEMTIEERTKLFEGMGLVKRGTPPPRPLE